MSSPASNPASNPASGSASGSERVASQPNDLVYDPYQYAIQEDPFPVYERLRNEAPLYWNEELKFWAVSRHRDVVNTFKDSQRYSSAEGVVLDKSASGKDAHRSQSFLAMDPPRHGRMRGLVSRGFTPRRVAELEPRIREIACHYLEEAIERETFDFIGDFAGRLPMDVICELMGVPVEDRVELRRLSELMVHREPGMRDVPPAGIEAAFGLAEYYMDLIALRRRTPQSDLVSALIELETDGEPLTNDELFGFILLMIVAGNETTTKLLGNAMYWGGENPSEVAKPFAEIGRVSDWVEETLRYDTSTHMLARVATETIPLYDGVIEPGERVVMLIGSANRDADVFDQAETFDLDRRTTETVSFGFGRHFCLGASLARLEARVALEELVKRVRSFELDMAGAERVHSGNVRGFAVLPTTVVPR